MASGHAYLSEGANERKINPYPAQAVVSSHLAGQGRNHFLARQAHPAPVAGCKRRRVRVERPPVERLAPVVCRAQAPVLRLDPVAICPVLLLPAVSARVEPAD